MPVPVKDKEDLLKHVTTRAALALIGAAVLTPALRGSERTQSMAAAPVLRSSMLVTTGWLQSHLADRNLVVLYIGQDRTRFDEGHVPRSHFVRLDDLVEQHTNSLNELPPVADLQALFESLGIGDNSRVVVMGDRGGVFAARAYFTLDYLGHGDQVSLLDGGLEQWAAEGKALSREEAHPAQASFTPRVQSGILVSTAQMQKLVQKQLSGSASAYVLLDARPTTEFDGVVNSEAVAQAGHIAGAHSLYWKNLIRSEADPTFLGMHELEQQFARAGARPGKTVITYCRTGMQSSLTYFVAKYLGYKAAMYDGSVYEWVKAAGNGLVVSPTRAGAAHP
jgi:thiosulfate/3-mercaptopyruvate sulfurtransferase